ncbi:MAG: hypothetical protein M1821_004292 [Bathelium mastoideum]|nr:MAG: hypothetical protein M1821_004292 [Bathelium mastoideum]KAI9684043.1 MAG: hypothetical protein M1822_005870 [Bathelium mastoideum]
MAEAGRKDFSDKAKEHITPDSSKSTTDKLKETVTSGGDKTARELQSDDSKTTTQSISDKFGREKDDKVHGGTGDSVLDKTKNALGLGGSNN